MTHIKDVGNVNTGYCTICNYINIHVRTLYQYKCIDHPNIVPVYITDHPKHIYFTEREKVIFYVIILYMIKFQLPKSLVLKGNVPVELRLGGRDKTLVPFTSVYNTLEQVVKHCTSKW